MRNKIRNKAVIIAVLAASFLAGAALGNVRDNSRNTKQGYEKGVQTATDAKQQRDITGSRIESHLQDEDIYNQIPNDKLAWYIKRDKNHEKSGCDDTLKLRDYNAYYLDTAASAKKEKVIYLTFDCGYENGLTDTILKVLKKHQAPACFFVTQTYIRDNIALVKRMKEEGHSVGNHTMTHPCMTDIGYEEIVHEIGDCASYMKEATGYAMDPYFRPPCGEYSARVLMLAKDLGYKTIFWSIAYKDYDVKDQPGSGYVIEHFKKYYHDGAIVLMHNVSSSNADALDTVLTNLLQEGYRFGNLDDLIEKNK